MIGNVNYIIVIYLLYLPDIKDDTILWYSLVFGFFYDFLLGSYLGSGILFFIFLSFIKISAEELFDMGNFSSKLALRFLIVCVFTAFNMLYFGYDMRTSAGYGFLRALADYAVYLAIFGIMEFGRAFSYVKR